ncbi:PBP1b-binding outer membrane lipoprotein LpoB [Phyllobacterium endophyticum]|nr:PBP1b-binding outer membrane lipoprotein LpoB [Phyllobacterium endophyticum]
MRLALSMVTLSLLIISGCTTAPKATAPAGPSPAKDTHFVPPPKSLTQRATPSKEPAMGDTAASAASTKPVAAQ